MTFIKTYFCIKQHCIILFSCDFSPAEIQMTFCCFCLQKWSLHKQKLFLASTKKRPRKNALIRFTVSNSWAFSYSTKFYENSFSELPLWQYTLVEYSMPLYFWNSTRNCVFNFMVTNIFAHWVFRDSWTVCKSTLALNSKTMQYDVLKLKLATIKTKVSPKPIKQAWNVVLAALLPIISK